MSYDNQKDVPCSTVPEDDTAVQTDESSEKTRELTDGEIASVAGGYVVVGGNPITPPPNTNHASPQ
jgi:hypothetical protein